MRMDDLETKKLRDSLVEYEGYRFTVLSVENNTIGTVKIEKLPEEC